MMNLLGKVTGYVVLKFGKLAIPIPYWQAAAIVFLLFLLVVMMAQFRRHYVNWSFKGALFGLFFGFLLALILEGFLIIGGRTVLTSIIGWKNPPAPIVAALDAGRAKLVQVLGINTEIPSSYAKSDSGVQGALETLRGLNPADAKIVKSIFCK
jgi:hypothetical protein